MGLLSFSLVSVNNICKEYLSLLFAYHWHMLKVKSLHILQSRSLLRPLCPEGSTALNQPDLISLRCSGGIGKGLLQCCGSFWIRPAPSSSTHEELVRGRKGLEQGKGKKPRGLEAPRFSGMSSQEDWGRGRGIVRQNNLQTDGLNQSPRDTLVLK